MVPRRRRRRRRQRRRQRSLPLLFPFRFPSSSLFFSSLEPVIQLRLQYGRSRKAKVLGAKHGEQRRQRLGSLLSRGEEVSPLGNGGVAPGVGLPDPALF